MRSAWPDRSAFRLVIENFSLKKERAAFPGRTLGRAFLSLLAGIVTPQEGVINVLGTDIANLRGAARDRFRAEP